MPRMERYQRVIYGFQERHDRRPQQMETGLVESKTDERKLQSAASMEIHMEAIESALQNS